MTSLKEQYTREMFSANRHGLPQVTFVQWRRQVNNLNNKFPKLK